MFTNSYETDNGMIQLPATFHVFSKEGARSVDFEKESRDFQKVLDGAMKESDVQSYIKENSKWFIPLCILKNYEFGHHFACVVPEFQLGTEYRVDYLLIGKNSLGYNYVFVEFEDVNIDYSIKNSNAESDKVRKGITQIRDWKRWIKNNKQYFENNPGIKLIDNHIPDYAFRYCLVVSRRSKMKEIDNNLRGELKCERGIELITYDRIVDDIRYMSIGI